VSEKREEMTDMEIVSGGITRRGEGAEEYPSRDLNHQTSGCSAINSQQEQQQPGPPTRQQGESYMCLMPFLQTVVLHSIIGLCVMLCVYQLNIGITSVRNKVFFSASFYCALR
jgi:hypothetical protein